MTLTRNTLLALMLAATACLAAPTRVSEIQVSGQDVVPEETIRRAIPTALLPGSVVEDLAGSLATTRAQVLKLGYFSEVQVTSERVPGGVRVKVQVTERPRILNVVFKGNTLLPEDQLRNLVRTVPESFLDDALVRRDLQRIVTAYEDSGAAADAVYAYIPEDKTLLFGVLEAVVAEINFQGLHSVTQAEALEKLGLQPEAVATIQGIHAAVQRLRETGWFADVRFQSRMERLKVEPPKLHLTLNLREAPGVFPDRVGKPRPDLTPEQVRALVIPPQVEVGFAVSLEWDSAPPSMQLPDAPLATLKEAAEAQDATVAQIRAHARALEAAGKREEAAAEYAREAQRAGDILQRDPGDIQARIAYAFALRDAGKGDEFLTQARECARLAPDNWQAQLALTNAAADRILAASRTAAHPGSQVSQSPGLVATAQIMPWPKVRQAALEALGVQAAESGSDLAEEAALALEKAQALAPDQKLPAVCALDRIQRVMAALARAGVVTGSVMAAFDSDRADRLAALRTHAEDDPELAVFVALVANARAVTAMLSGADGDEKTPAERQALMGELTQIAARWPQSLRVSGGILGMAHLTAREFDKARAVFETMIQQAPEDREPYNALMAVAYSALDWEGLAAAARRRLEHSRDAVDYIILGKTALLMGRADEVLAHFQQALDLFPSDPLGYNATAGWLIHTGQDDALAARRVEKSLELAPGSPYPLALKAALALLASKPEEAPVPLSAALQAAPADEFANTLRTGLFAPYTGVPDWSIKVPEGLAAPAAPR